MISLCCLFHWQENYYTEIFVGVDINKSVKMKYELRRNGKQTITFIFIYLLIHLSCHNYASYVQKRGSSLQD